jgi:hypothetical protein
MNRIDSQTPSEIPTVILSSQTSLLGKEDSQITAIALAALDGQPSLKRSLSTSSDSLSAKHVRTIPTEQASDEEITAYLKLDTWRSEKNRELLISTLINCFREKRDHLVLPDLGSAHLPNCLEKMTWVISLEIRSTKDLNNTLVLTKLPNLRCLSLIGETKDLSFLRSMPFLKKLSISYNPGLKKLSFLKNYENLTKLQLHYNASLKDLSEIKPLAKTALKHLKKLSLSGKFRDLSFLESLPFLQKLSLSSNPALTNLSFLKNTPDLLKLSLRNNKNLKKLSGIESLIRLVKIDLSETPIKNFLLLDDLPKLKYRLPHGNPVGIPRQKSTLGLLRGNIENEALQRVNLRPFIDSHPNIASWLKRLTNGDRDKPMPAWTLLQPRRALSEHVLEILKFAQQDPLFAKDILLPLVDNSMTSCSDRTTYYLNEIIRQYELYKTKDLPVSQALPVFEKYHRLFLVKDLASESAERRNLLHEEIEVHLNFFHKLDVALPFLDTAHTNLHWIKASDREIEDAEDKLSQKLENPLEWIRYLCLDPFWQKRLFIENPALTVEFSNIEESKYEELEAILADAPNHPAPFKELEIKHKENIVATLGRETLQILENRLR